MQSIASLVWAWLGLYAFIYVIILVASPREVYNSDMTIEFRRVFWYALIVFGFILLMFALIHMLQKRSFSGFLTPSQ